VSFISLTIGNFQLIVNSFGVFMLNTETSDIWFESNPNFDLPYGTYILTLQTDGNLVGHNTANVQFWASNTAGEGSPPYTLSINSGGNCILSAVADGWAADPSSNAKPNHAPANRVSDGQAYHLHL
jgi:hypothetical protein